MPGVAAESASGLNHLSTQDTLTSFSLQLPPSLIDHSLGSQIDFSFLLPEKKMTLGLFALTNCSAAHQAPVVCLWFCAGGAVVPLVYLATPNAAPLPTDAVTYTFNDSPTATIDLSDSTCPVFMTLNGLSQAGQAADLQGTLIRVGNGFPVEPLCNSTAVTHPVVFGPFAKNQCGKYAFESVWGYDPAFVWDAQDLRLNITVTGC